MNLLSTIVAAVITSGVVTTILTAYIKSRELENQRRWEIKREACLEALEIIDARFANYDWKSPSGSLLQVDSQDIVSTAKIRSCFNRLVLACNDSEVPQLFEKCLNLRIGNIEPQPLDMGTVVNLRLAIRKELGFGKILSTELAWIININWKNSKEKSPR